MCYCWRHYQFWMRKINCIYTTYTNRFRKILHLSPKRNWFIGLTSGQTKCLQYQFYLEDYSRKLFLAAGSFGTTFWHWLCPFKLSSPAFQFHNNLWTFGNCVHLMEFLLKSSLTSMLNFCWINIIPPTSRHINERAWRQVKFARDWKKNIIYIASYYDVFRHFQPCFDN